MTFKEFRHKSTGVVRSYPEHYINHPVFGDDLEPYEPEVDEYEEEKVVVETHELPVEQRATKTATAKQRVKDALAADNEKDN